MAILEMTAGLLKKIASFIGQMLKKGYETVKPIAEEKAGELLDKLSVEKVNLTFSKLTSEIKAKLADPTVAKAAVCDVKNLTKLHPNVPEWEKLAERGITHMLITIDHDEKISAAYFYQDMSLGADQQVSELINRTGEATVVVNS